MATNSMEHDLKCLSIEELEKIAANMMDKQTRDYYNEVSFSFKLSCHYFRVATLMTLLHFRSLTCPLYLPLLWLYALLLTLLRALTLAQPSVKTSLPSKSIAYVLGS